MKKALSILLAAIMVISLAAIVPSSVFAREEAADPVAISDAAGFAAMEPNGSFYLTKDIEISETYTAEFTGTFDGKGHKITTSVTLFEKFSGTATDLVMEGSVSSTRDRGGVFANTLGGCKLSKIINKANFTGSDSKVTEYEDDLKVGGVYGGIAGTSLKKVEVEVTDCENYGTITGYDAGGLFGMMHANGYYKNLRNFGTVTGVDCGGGITSWEWQDCTFENCQNGSETVRPEVSCSGDYAGGIVSYISGNSAVDFIGCVNYGTMHGVNSGCAGILGRSGDGDTINIVNCINYGAINGENYFSGGMAANLSKETILTIKNSENRGDVTVTGESGNTSAGGMVGYAKENSKITCEDCRNYGKIVSGGAYAGGMVARTESLFAASRCFNYGEINGYKQAAGIICNLNNSDIDGPCPIEYCGNKGKIKAEKDTAAGIIAYAYGSVNKPLKVHYCYNTADVIGGCEASGIIGYTNNMPVLECIGCFNLGNISSTDTGEMPTALYYSKAGDPIPAENTTGNFYLKDCAMREARIQGGDYSAMNSDLTVDDFKSGRVCYMLNQAAGREVYRQTIGTDLFPSLDPNSRTVYFENGEYFNEKAPVNPPVNPPVTGDAIVWVAVVAVVSLLGMGIALKARNN